MYEPFAGSGISSGIGLGVYVTVWNVALENVTLSPAATVNVEGMNWLRRTGNSEPTRDLALLAENTLYVVAVGAP